MVVRLQNQRVPQGWTPNPGRFFYNCLTCHNCWIPFTEEPKVRLALACNVPQHFIVLQGDGFLISAPDLPYLDKVEPACTICGDTPFPGQELLDRDFEADFEATCQRCHPAYLCNLCLCDHKVCLACLEPEEEDMLDDKHRCRLAALKRYWEIQDEREGWR